MVKKRIFCVVDKTNVAEFQRKFAARDWGNIDVRKFSKASNESVLEYYFSIGNLLRD